MTEEKIVQKLDENFESVLAVVAHPDDLEYGAASAIAQCSGGIDRCRLCCQF